MADDDIRDDGTVICALHGMRYDPAVSDGCIRCPRSLAPGKRSGPPRSLAPARASSAAPSLSGRPAARPSVPAVPFETSYLDSPGYAQGPYAQQQSGPVITIMAGPRQRTSRRGLLGFLSVVVLGGAGAAAWYFRPEGATDWASKITPFRYGPNGSLSGSLFLPSAASERPCPLLLLLDPARKSAKICTRFARHCEQQGWIAASSDAFGNVASPSDNDAVALFLEGVRANASVDGGRPVIAGYESAGDAACRLAILEPKLFSGAILECCETPSWRDLGAMARNDVAFLLVARRSDATREPMRTMKDEMQRRGLHVTYEELTGGHQPMERDELDPAFAWLATIRG
jgi:hypothetical protein